MVSPYDLLAEASRPTDKELLAFLLLHMRSQNLKMDGLSTWYFPSNLIFKDRAKGPREALEAACQRYKDSLPRKQLDQRG